MEKNEKALWGQGKAVNKLSEKKSTKLTVNMISTKKRLAIQQFAVVNASA